MNTKKKKVPLQFNISVKGNSNQNISLTFRKWFSTVSVRENTLEELISLFLKGRAINCALCGRDPCTLERGWLLTFHTQAIWRFLSILAMRHVQPTPYLRTGSCFSPHLPASFLFNIYPVPKLKLFSRLFYKYFSENLFNTCSSYWNVSSVKKLILSIFFPHYSILSAWH